MIGPFGAGAKSRLTCRDRPLAAKLRRIAITDPVGDGRSVDNGTVRRFRAP